MKNILNFLLLLSLIVVLSSCEGSTNYTYRVHNTSSFDISLEIESFFSVDTLQTISSGKEVIVMTGDMLGGRESSGSPSNHITKFLIYNSTDTMTKDFETDENWTIKSDHVRKIPSAYEHEFLLTFSDSDF